MHAYLILANIMVSVISLLKGFNADAMEAMMDRLAPVCIVQFQLGSVALFTEIRVHARSILCVSAFFYICINACMRCCACTCLSSFIQQHILSVIVVRATILSLAKQK